MNESVIYSAITSLYESYPSASPEEIADILIAELEYKILPDIYRRVKVPKEERLHLLREQMFLRRVGQRARQRREEEYEKSEKRNRLIREYNFIQSQLNRKKNDAPFYHIPPWDSSLSITHINGKRYTDTQITNILRVWEIEDTEKTDLKEKIEDNKLTNRQLGVVKHFDRDLRLYEETIKDKLETEDEDLTITSQALRYMRCENVSEEIEQYLQDNLELLEKIVTVFSQLYDQLDLYNPSNDLTLHESGFDIIEMQIFLNVDDTAEYYEIIDKLYDRLSDLDVDSRITLTFKNISTKFDPFTYLIENPIEDEYLTSEKYRELVE